MGAKMAMGCVMLCVGLVMLMGSGVSSSKFDELFEPAWAMDHFVYQGETLKMKLDNFSGNFLLQIYASFFVIYVYLCVCITDRMFHILIYQELGFRRKTSTCSEKSQSILSL